jgi:alanine racemase
MYSGIVTWAEVDLDAIASNVQECIHYTGENVQVFAVVKANAYGHGALPVARAALRAGASRLAVHRALEGVELRRGGIQAPILIMGYTPAQGADVLARNQLTPALTTLECARAYAAAARRAGWLMPIHIKVDTGMSRFGITPDQVTAFARQVGELPGIQIEGLFTHFATADWCDQRHVLDQLTAFQLAVQDLQAAGIHPAVLHTANSAAIMRLPQAHFNAVRLGVAMYGMLPSEECPPVFKLRPALSLKSLVTRVDTIPPHHGISYGRTYITQKPTRIALVPVGYGDGYHRLLSNRGSVLIHGRRAPILGRVCMDQFVVDISHISEVQIEDEVILLGEQGTDAIRVEELARLAETINYEITTALLPRVIRIYREQGEWIESGGLSLAHGGAEQVQRTDHRTSDN